MNINDAATITRPLTGGWDDEKKADERHFDQQLSDSFGEIFIEENDDDDLHRHLDATER